jgi:phage terminase large subunit-like protein
VTLSLRQAVSDRELLGAHPAYACGLETFRLWLYVHDIIEGNELDAEGLAFFQQISGRANYNPPAGGWQTIALVAPRQIGKSLAASTLVAWYAVKPGPRGTYAILAAQSFTGASRSLLSTVKEFFRQGLLAREVVSELSDSITLAGGCTVAVWPTKPAALRGVRARVVIVDEADFLSSDNGSDVTRAMIQAARPTTATTGGKLILISSPNRWGSSFHKLFLSAFGVDDPHTLALRLPLSMNPTLPESYIAGSRAGDPVAAAQELDALWIEESERSLFDTGALASCVVTGRPAEIEPAACRGRVHAFADPASGSKGADHFGLTLGYRDPDSERVVICCLKKWSPPFSAAAVVAEAADVLKRYHVRTLKADSFAGGIFVDLFKAHGIALERAGKSASDCYLDAVAAFGSGTAELPCPESSELGAALMSDLRSVVRKSGGERDRADAPRTRFGHADLGNAVCGLISCAVPAKRERPKSAMPQTVRLGRSTWAMPWAGGLSDSSAAAFGLED